MMEKLKDKLRVAVVGARGYVGTELVRLLVNHPRVEITYLTSETYHGQEVVRIYPNLRKKISLHYEKLDPSRLPEVADLVFLALPHGNSFSLVSGLMNAEIKVIDTSGDFRLKDLSSYQKWYGTPHLCPHLLPQAVYGLPELNRSEIREASLVANPGCYPVSIILALAPLVKQQLINREEVIASSLSGVSGAGATLSNELMFCSINENIHAYRVGGTHQHIPEIEQELSRIAGEKILISFVPHLTPLNRGIYSTIFLSPLKSLTITDLREIYQEFYGGEFFIRILPDGQVPELKAVYGSNYCDIGFKIDEHAQKIIVISALDNLMKGAAGNAVQNMNLILNWPENLGLDLPGIIP